MNVMTQTPHLTPRERQIIRAVARGLGNREIAAELGISAQTVKNQLSTVYSKVGVKSRVQLALYAVKERLV
jgi:DNA-binding NarL/FixJ family response regulator